MKFTQLAYLAALLPAASLAQWTQDWGNCLSQYAADLLVQRYAAVIAQQPSDLGNASVTAAAITAPNYMEYSDSANSNIGIPLGDPTVPNKTAFVDLSQVDPPVDTTTLGVFVANCNNVVWQWVSTNFGSGQYEVKGIHIFELASPTVIEVTYFEFNSVAGALDTGFTIITPSGVTET